MPSKKNNSSLRDTSKKKQPAVIQVQDVWKLFRQQKQRTLKEMLPALIGQGKKGVVNTFWALKDINFSVEKGEAFGIIGVNGSGKSTMLKILAGVTQATRGDVKIKGVIAPLIELGAGFHPELTGKENIYLNGAILGMSRSEIDDKYAAIVAFSELKDFIDQPVKHYSSGMYLRLAFAVAIHSDFDVLLVDEILAVGDMKFQAKCMNRIRQFRRAGKTIIFVSHDLGTVRSLCDRVMLLDHGNIENIGNATEVVDQFIQGQQKVQAQSKLDDVSELSSADQNDITTQSIHQKDLPKEKILTIKKVEFLDKNGRSQRDFISNESVEIKIHFIATQDVPEVVFGIALYRSDGYHLYGTNSLIQGKELDIKKGSGSVSFYVPKIPILSDTILLTVAAHNQQLQNFDWQEKKYNFNVMKSQTEAEGLVDFGAKFIHSKQKTE